VRLFVAVEPPAEALDHLAAFTAGLAVVRTGTRVTARHLWHVTLAFLGEVPEERVPAAIAAVDGTVTGQEPPGLRISGGGRFGRGRFTIMWAGISGDLRPLRLALAKQLRKAKLPYDDKRFHPHLTVARPGDRLPRDEIEADVAALKTYHGPQWMVDRLRLVRSHLGPKPRYETMHEARVG
jgi:RNA 2',3'-cyclic 3'-phosphodiesterase